MAKRLIVTALNQRGAEPHTKADDLCLLFCGLASFKTSSLVSG
jgi:hypothetical protein